MGWFDWDTNVDSWAQDRLRRMCGHEKPGIFGKSVPFQPFSFNLVDILGKKLRLRFLLPSHEFEGVEYAGNTEILTCVNTCEVHKTKNGGGQIILHIAPMRVMTKSGQTDKLLALAFQSPDLSEACTIKLVWEGSHQKEHGKIIPVEAAIIWD